MLDEPSVVDRLTERDIQYFTEYEDIDSYWNVLEERNERSLSFRFPDYEEKPLNSLGKAVRIAMASKVLASSTDEPAVSVNLHYRDKDLKSKKIPMPQVTTVIDGEEYGEISADSLDNCVEVPASTLPDLYTIGLAVHHFHTESRSEDSVYKDIENEKLAARGKQIAEKYSFDDTGKYELFSNQGENIQERAREEYLDEIIEDALDK